MCPAAWAIQMGRRWLNSLASARRGPYQRQTMKIDWFLVAMAAAITLAMLFPDIGASDGPLHLSLVTQIGVALLFFLHGAKLSPADLRAGAVNWRVHVVIHGATFVLFPLMGAAVYFGTGGLLDEHLRLGVFFLCALS